MNDNVQRLLHSRAPHYLYGDVEMMTENSAIKCGVYLNRKSTILARNYATTAANRKESDFGGQTRHPRDMVMIVKAVMPARSLSIKSISVMFQEISCGLFANYCQ